MSEPPCLQMLEEEIAQNKTLRKVLERIETESSEENIRVISRQGIEDNEPRERLSMIA